MSIPTVAFTMKSETGLEENTVLPLHFGFGSFCHIWTEYVVHVKQPETHTENK